MSIVNMKNRLASNFPTYLNVLGTRFRVQISKGALKDEDTEEELNGVTYASTSLIVISDSLDTSKRWKTLLHEYIHAVLHVAGTGALIEGEEREEALVCSLESGLVQLIEQVGPQLIKYIKDEHTEEEGGN